MNDRPVPVRFEEVLGSRLHQVGAEQPQSLAEPDPRRRLVVRYLTAEGAHPRGVEVRGSWASRTVRGFAGPAEQARTVHPRSVTIEVRQSREHVADRSVDRRARLVSNRSSTRLLHRAHRPTHPIRLSPLSLLSEVCVPPLVERASVGIYAVLRSGDIREHLPRPVLQTGSPRNCSAASSRSRPAHPRR